MNRRRFTETAGSALAGAALAGWTARVSSITVPATVSAPTNATAFHSARRLASTKFGKIAYVERGTGDVALFLHGFPLNGFQWRGALDRLSTYRRCIAPDFLAMGYTEVAEGQSVAPNAQVAMLTELLDRLSISSVDLIANDSGGAVAQLLVARHPRRVRTLLLTNCDTEPDSPPAAMRPVIALSKQGKFVDEWLAPWRADKARARSKDGIGGMCYANPTHPTDEAIETYFAPLLSSARHKSLVHAYAIALEQNPLAGIEVALKQCKVPTRIVWGSDDTIFSPASAEYLDHTFGNSHGVRHLRGSKLFWPEERPGVIAEEACRLWSIA